jgi:hypothetical protein
MSEEKSLGLGMGKREGERVTFNSAKVFSMGIGYRHLVGGLKHMATIM